MKTPILLVLFSLVFCSAIGQKCNLYNKIRKLENETLRASAMSVEVKSFKDFVKYRRKLYHKEDIDICTLDSFIIIEGVAPAWGKYVGLLISENKVFSYKYEPLHSELNFIKPSEILHSDKVFIEKNIIKDALEWKVDKAKGGHICDGYKFIAIKVVKDDMKSILFDDY